MNLRRRAIMASKKARLPIEYQEVEYLESTGEQYIDTGVQIDNGYTIRIDIEFTSFSLMQIITGTYMMGGSAYSDAQRYFLRVDSATGYLHYQYNSATKYGGANLRLNTKYNIECKLTVGEQYLKLNGQLLVSTTLNSNQGQTRLYFLAGRETIGATNRSYARIYNCKYFNYNNLLVRDFIPCYRKSDNKPGMYDLVTKTFFTNQGTGEFLVGADVN